MEMNSPEDLDHGSTTSTENTFLFESKCSNCELEASSEEFLACSTCNESSDTIKKFCDACISSHVRRGHNVLDHRGYTVSVCDKHKIINDLFCKTCTLILCNKCLLAHLNHNVITVAEKGKENRSKLFEYLGKFELLSKDTKFQQMILQNAVKERNKCSEEFNGSRTVDILVGIIGKYVRNLLKSEQYELNLEELTTILIK